MRRCDAREDEACERRRLAIKRQLPVPERRGRRRGSKAKQRGAKDSVPRRGMRGAARKLSEGSLSISISQASLSDSSLSVDGTAATQGSEPAPESDDIGLAAGDEDGDYFSRFVVEEAALARAAAAAEDAVQKSAEKSAAEARQKAQREYEEGLVRSRKLAQDRSEALLERQRDDARRREEAEAAKRKMRVDVSAAATEALRREQALQERRRQKEEAAKVVALRNRKKKGLRNEGTQQIPYAL